MMKGIEKFYSIQETTSLIINPSMPRSRHVNEVRIFRLIEYFFYRNLNHASLFIKQAAAEKRLVENEITRYLRLLNEQILYRYDPELAKHLEKCDISLTLFGV